MTRVKLNAKERYQLITQELRAGNEFMPHGLSDHNIIGLNKLSFSISSKGYLTSRIQQSQVTLHKIIWIFHNGHIPKNLVVDHINRNKLDNHLNNLRLASMSENASNKEKSRTKKRSKYKGVQKTKSGKYQACVWYHGKNHCFGSYEKEEEAALMYNIKAKEIQKEFAYQNIITINP